MFIQIVFGAICVVMLVFIAASLVSIHKMLKNFDNRDVEDFYEEDNPDDVTKE